jgi:hypothetical protein
MDPINDPRRKFRQAAFAYLHVGLLYEAAVLAAWRADLLPALRGPVPLWLLGGAAIVALVFWGLWTGRNWFARVVWGVHALRLPALIAGAFFPAVGARLPPSFYMAALIVVVANLWLLARAGWDL